MKIKRILTTFAICFTIGFLSASTVNASGLPAGCEPPFGIPSACPSAGDYEPDFNCINAKVINPKLECCPNRCVGGATIGEDPSESLQPLTKFNIFNTQISLDFRNPNTIPTLVNLLISTALGIVSLYVLFRGIYIAAFVRTRSTSPEDIAKVNKELTNLLIGFLIAWGSIFIVQLVANLLGLGSLSNLSVSGTEDALLITIQ